MTTRYFHQDPDDQGGRSEKPAPTVEGDILGRRAVLLSGRIPHDPTSDEPDICPECGTSWPCETRSIQRKDKRSVVAWLTADGYSRVKPLDGDPPGARFTNPAGWSVWITYGFGSLVGTVRCPDGSPFAANTHATAEWLDEVLT